MTTRNIELTSELRDLKVQKATTPLDELGRAVAATVDRANATLAGEAPPGSPRWAVVEVTTSIRGLIGPSANGLAIEIPAATVHPDLLGTVQLSLRQVPQAATNVALPTSPPSRLGTALERVQSSFGRWSAGRGTTAARRVVDEATVMLGATAEADTDVQTPAVTGLAAAVAQFAEQTRLKGLGALGGMTARRSSADAIAEQLDEISRIVDAALAARDQPPS